MRRRRLALIVALCVSACGGEPSGPGEPRFEFSAVAENGAVWRSLESEASASVSQTGEIHVRGRSLGGEFLLMDLSLIPGPGTYPLGTGVGVQGGTLSFGSGPGTNTYRTATSGRAGWVTVSEISGQWITGSFAFTVQNLSTSFSFHDGKFSVPATVEGPIVIDPRRWSRLTGRLNGDNWNAASLLVDSVPASGALSFTAANTEYQLDLYLGNWMGAGRYEILFDEGRNARVLGRQGGIPLWGDPGSVSSGEVEIVKVTPERIDGRIRLDLGPRPLGGGPGRILLEAEFELGVPEQP